MITAAATKRLHHLSSHDSHGGSSMTYGLKNREERSLNHEDIYRDELRVIVGYDGGMGHRENLETEKGLTPATQIALEREDSFCCGLANGSFISLVTNRSGKGRQLYCGRSWGV